MARYDYHCPACGARFEFEHPMGERPEVRCPSCGKVAERVFDPSGIVFKGSGFYNTDQRGSHLSSSAEKPSDSASGSSASPKCENCPHKG